MIHEACDIVEDAGGWTCRTCRAHWRTSIQPDTCAEARVPADAPTDRSVLIVLAVFGIGAVICLAVGLAGGLAP